MLFAIIGIRKELKEQARLRNHLQLATETASHITPLSPWRGAGGEAGCEPCFARWNVHKQLTLSPYNAVLPRLSI